MMTSFKYFFWIGCSFIGNYWFQFCKSTTSNEVPYGSQIISTWFLNPSTGKLYKHPYMPDQELMYYGNFLIEKEIDVNQTTITGRNNNSTTDVNYKDTVYYLINFKADSCAEYKHFLPSAKSPRLFKLKDKPSGINFNPVNDTSFAYSPNLPLRDTMIDGASSKYFKIYKKSFPEQEATYYFGPKGITSLVHLDKQVDNDYKGTVVRMDLFTKETNEFVSIRMDIKPNNLSEDQISVIKSWIRSNNW